MMVGTLGNTGQGASLGDLITILAEWTLVALAAWAGAIAVALIVTAVGRRDALGWVGCPPALRRALLSLCGLALVTAPTAAMAASTANGQGYGDRSPLDGLPSLARPLGAVQGDSSTDHVVVRPGDSLWRLCARRWPDAGPARLAAAVRATHELNRTVIGPDPDLIQPGTRLRLPRFPDIQPPATTEESR